MAWRLCIIWALAFTLATISLASPLPKLNAKVGAKIKAAGASVSVQVNLFSGLATWFIPSKEGGSVGACGPKEADNAMIVALNAAQYGPLNQKSKYCGKKIQITGPNGKKVTATINDACPGCKKNSLDLTQSLFKKLGSLNTGILNIKWKFID